MFVIYLFLTMAMCFGAMLMIPLLFVHVKNFDQIRSELEKLRGSISGAFTIKSSNTEVLPGITIDID